MSTWFLIVTVLFIIVSAVMILIILVQRPQGGGLAGAFGGAGGGGTDTVFGGRVGDALTVMTTVAFAAYLLLAIGLNVMDTKPSTAAATMPAVTSTTLPDDQSPADVSDDGTTAPPVVIPEPPVSIPLETESEPDVPTTSPSSSGGE